MIPCRLHHGIGIDQHTQHPRLSIQTSYVDCVCLCIALGSLQKHFMHANRITNYILDFGSHVHPAFGHPDHRFGRPNHRCAHPSFRFDPALAQNANLRCADPTPAFGYPNLQFGQPHGFGTLGFGCPYPFSILTCMSTCPKDGPCLVGNCSCPATCKRLRNSHISARTWPSTVL